MDPEGMGTGCLRPEGIKGRLPRGGHCQQAGEVREPEAWCRLSTLTGSWALAGRASGCLIRGQSASPRSAAQGAGEEARDRGDHRADGGWEASGGA